MMYRFNLYSLAGQDLTKATTVCVMFLAGGQDLTKATTVCVRLFAGCWGVQEMPSRPPVMEWQQHWDVGTSLKSLLTEWKLLHPHLCSRYHPISCHLCGSSWTLLSTPHIFLCPEIDSWIVEENERFGAHCAPFSMESGQAKESDLKLNLHSGCSQRRKQVHWIIKR